MPMMTKQILKFVDSPKIQKYNYFEHKTLLFLQIKQFIPWLKNIFKVEITVSGTAEWKLQKILTTKILLTYCFKFIVSKKSSVFLWCRCKVIYLNPSHPNSGRREKINLNFYFHISLWCLKRFYEDLKGFHKIF